jgi:hypothetical protein
VRSHRPVLPRTQRQIILETFSSVGNRRTSAQRLGISVNTYDNHVQAAFRSRRQPVDPGCRRVTEVDRSFWYDDIEEFFDRYEASHRAARPRKKGNVLPPKATVPTLKATAASSDTTSAPSDTTDASYDTTAALQETTESP